MVKQFDIEQLIPFKGNKTFSQNAVLLIAYGYLIPKVLGFIPGLPDLNYGLPYSISAWVMQPWTSVSYFLVSNSFFGALSAGLWLYYFGRIGQDIIGTKKLNTLFWIAGIGVGVLYLLTSLVFPQFTTGLLATHVAVSAVVYAVGYYFPTYRVFLFGAIEIELRWLAVFKAIMDLLSAFSAFSQGIWTVLGGTIGLLIAMSLKGNINLPFIDNLMDKEWFKPKNPKPNRPKIVSINKYTPKASTAPIDDEELNALLDKINKFGYHALSEEEKKILFDKSKEI